MREAISKNDLLYSEVKGSGKHLLLLHGWAMHGGIWGEFKETLAQDYTVHTIDLPGFGFSNNMQHDFTLDAYSQSIEAYIDNIGEKVVLLGWSLGGLIALNILKRNNVLLEKLILVATTPCFTKKENWQTAMDSEVFDAFASDLKNNYEKTLKRFLSLQTRGSTLNKNDLRELNTVLNERGKPNLQALEQGLSILSQSDLRNVHENDIATMYILGERDTLVPVEVMDKFNSQFENNKKLILDKAAHLPFLSHSDDCIAEIKNFINDR